MASVKISLVGKLVPLTFIILAVHALLLTSVSGLKCPGRCVANATLCKSRGGKIAGYCTNELPCCDYTFRKIGYCGSTMSKLNTAFFRSPDYPDYAQGDLVCQFDFVLDRLASGIIVEFTDILTEGNGFTKNSPCEADMIYFKGFRDWTPPALCGNITKYAAVIDLGNTQTKDMKTFTVLAIMSSNKYRWNLKISQVFRSPKKTSSFHIPDPDPQDYRDSGEEDEPGEEDAGDEGTQVSPIKSELLHEETESEEQEIARLVQLSHSTQVKINYASNDYTLPMIMEGDYNDDALEEEPFIVNGMETEISTVPWQASIRTVISTRMAKLLPALELKNCTLQEGVHFCGGSIISDTHILLAAHCFHVGEKLSSWQRLSSVKVVLGDSNLCDEKTEGVQEFKVEKVYFHYAFDSEMILNDVVIIKLQDRINITDKVKPIKLAAVDSNFEEELATASGWGLTNLTIDLQKTPEQLQTVSDLFLGNKSYCSKQQMALIPSVKRTQLLRYQKYRNIFSSLLCTFVRNGTIPKVIGQGDSGGPLVIFSRNKEGSEMNESEPQLIGVISYMIPIPHKIRKHDVSNYVDFYQSVAFFRSWIDIAMQ